MKSMTVHELQTRQAHGERFQLVDVRTPGEYAAGHVPCAANIPMDQLEARLDDVHRHEPVVLICQSGRRASVCQGLVAPYGHESFVLDGGTAAWERAGLPVVRGTATRWAIERQVRLVAGLVVATGAALAFVVDPVWGLLPMIVGAGLAVAAVTNRCGLGTALTYAPWNRAPAACVTPNAAASPER